MHVGLLIKGLSPPALLPLAQAGEDRLANQEQACTTQLSGDYCPVATTRIHPQHCVENGIHHNELAGRLDRDAHEGAEGGPLPIVASAMMCAPRLLGSTQHRHLQHDELAGGLDDKAQGASKEGPLPVVAPETMVRAPLLGSTRIIRPLDNSSDSTTTSWPVASTAMLRGRPKGGHCP